ncbi:DUF3048 domain-containing protein [Virgibacillus litoralis]|uniref:DUF3048 domain-containing protein n=1 Tax=Virgibacillus litoralis TaxID=578221 RepID=A0ABS4HC51_9BACI|nr:DUF3048 domain-containing protein [Virgibacillus litoralis]MBP1948224.1 hypothetical protein [Virgibacillus litoralis]
MKKALFYFLLLLMFVLLAACSDEKQEAEDNGAKENAVEEKDQLPDPKEAEKSNTFPLTGIKTDQKVNDRIVSVMINNHTKARPQTGLSSADVVFEFLAEGKITRFLAMFQSEKPEVVGPVRSAREYYFEMADRYDALYIYHGAANFVNDMIKKRGIEHLDGAIYDNDGHLFKRESFRRAPHNSYLQFGAVYDVASQKGYDVKHSYKPLPFLSEDETKNISGDEANHVEIVYSDNPMEIVEYEYDEKNEKYTRYSDRKKTVELNSEEPIQVDNIFIVETYHEVIDDAGRRAIDMTSGGNGYLIHKGKVKEVQWENRDGRIIPVKDGQPVEFVQGKTWVNVIPSSPGIDQSVSISN